MFSANKQAFYHPEGLADEDTAKSLEQASADCSCRSSGLMWGHMESAQVTGETVGAEDVYARADCYGCISRGQMSQGTSFG